MDAQPGRLHLRVVVTDEGWIGQGVSGLTWLGSVAFLALAVAHGLSGDGVLVLVWLHTATWWLPLGVIPFVGVALFRRRPLQAVPGATVLALWVVFNRPPAPPEALPSGKALRVVSANALMVNPTPGELVAEVLSYEPDVVVFQEFTPDIQAAIEGVPTVPHAREHPAWHSFGVGIYSRYPITSERLVRIGDVDWQRAVLDVEGRSVEVWNVHTLPPFHGENHQAWLGQVAAIAAQAKKVEGPLVVAGDFNLTRHHQGYRDLTASMRDAHRDCGRWVASTWPVNGYFFRWAPRVRLDHVFLGGGVRCAAIREGTGPGSDHRPVVADLVLPR